MYHPDSPGSHALPRHVCHSRFQAITAAHDVLTGKQARGLFASSASSSRPSSRHRRDDPADHAYEEFMRTRWRRPGHAHMHGFSEEWAEYAGAAESRADDRWKDRVIMALGLGVRPLYCISLKIPIKNSLFSESDDCNRDLPINFTYSKLCRVRYQTSECRTEPRASKT